MLKSLRIIIFSAFLLIFPLFAGAFSVLEETLVQLTNYSANSQTNVDLTFTAVADNDDSNGYLEIFFNDFSLTGIGEDDVDLLIDSVQQDIEGCVVIDADSVTIGDWDCLGVDPADGDVFRVLIGTNTSHESVGGNRVVTPDYELGGQYMSIVATMFDGISGSSRSYFAIPLYDGSSRSVGAVVGTPVTPPPPDGGGGGGGGGDGDNDPPSYGILVNDPRAGDAFSAGQRITINWQTLEDPIALVNIKYRDLVSGNELTVASNQGNSGTYSWLIPASIASSSRSIIIVEGTDGAILLASDSSEEFEILGEEAQFIQLVSPNGGEQFEIGQTARIIWNESGEYPLSVEISRDGGDSWSQIADLSSSQGQGFNFFDWTVAGPVTEEALIRINSQSLNDVSDEVFSIVDSIEDSVLVISPNGGEVFTSGSEIPLNWTASGDVPAVDLFVSDGEEWLQVATDIDSGLQSYIWSSPSDISTDEALFRVVSSEDDAVIDESDAVFSIIPEDEIEATVRVLYPNGGEVFAPGQTVSVSIEYSGEYDALDLLVSLDGANYSPILTNAPFGVSQFSWQVPNTETELGFVRADIISEDLVIATDISDAPFSIVAEEEEPEDEPEDIPVDPGPDPIDSEGIDGQLQFITFQGGLILPDRGDRSFEALNGVTLIARAVDGEGVASLAEMSLNGRVLQMNQVGNGVFELPIVASDTVGAVTFSSGEDREVLSYSLDALPYGIIRDAESGEVISGALSFVLNQSGSQINTAPYGFSNPTLTSASGAIAWMLPNGVYEVTVAREGYRSQSRSVSVNNLILNPSFELVADLEPLPEPDPIPGEDAQPEAQQPDAEVSVVAGAVAVVSDAVRALQENSVANVITDISEPAIIVTSVAGVAILASSFGALSYLQYLFTAPLLFFTRRRRNATGVVYNAITKVPIGLATIRVFDEKGRIVKSLVSDPRGHFSIKISKGRYSIQVIKEGFIFPSDYLKGRKADESYIDLYTGGLIEVEKDGALLSINIPLDPSSVSSSDLRGLYLKKFLRLFQNIASHLGIIIAIFVVIVQPGTVAYLILGLQALLYAGTRILIAPRGSRGWGLVVDAKTGKPIRQAVVRLFEPKFNKLIETQITDRKGRYSITAGPNSYYLTSKKDGYKEKKVDNIDYSGKKEPEVIAVDISLEPEGGNEV